MHSSRGQDLNALLTVLLVLWQTGPRKEDDAQASPAFQEMRETVQVLQGGQQEQEEVSVCRSPAGSGLQHFEPGESPRGLDAGQEIQGAFT
jgi:hypothetical protein